MQMQSLLLTQQDYLATITLHRTDKANAMNGQMMSELITLLKKLADDPITRVVIMQAAGKHFCAGADLAWMKELATSSYEKNYRDAQQLADLLYLLYTFPKPTLALVHGTTCGGGLGLLAACDIAIAAENASFSFPEVKIGLIPATISPYILNAIGERAAHYYFLTAEIFDAKRAAEIGLIHQVVTQENLAQEGLNIARSLLKNGWHAMNEVKKLIRQVKHQAITEELAQYTAEQLANIRVSSEAQAGFQAFLERKK